MPSTGFYLFLQKTEKREEICLKGVNALNGLLLISSEILETEDENVKMCQCPQRASTYFFELKKKSPAFTTELCQCPQRASTYFFSLDTDPSEIYAKRVNALNGLLLISSLYVIYYNRFGDMCQCPQRASTYFFQIQNQLSKDVNECVNALNGLLLISSKQEAAEKSFHVTCQCPQRASTYFFLQHMKLQKQNSKRVNALNGLLLISSVLLRVK